MKKMTIMVLAGILMTAMVAPALALGPFDADAGLAVNGKYVWRGMVVSPDPVVQPFVELGLMGFGLGFWGNIDTNDVNDQEWKFNEIDWTLSYGLSLPMLELGAGFIYYDFPNSEAEATTEFFIGAAANVPLSPSLTIYQDIDAVKGAYWEAGISHAVTISAGTDLELSAGVGLGSEGYIKGYFGPASFLAGLPEMPGGASLTDYHLSAGVPFHPVPFVTVTPSVTYSTLGGDVKDYVDGAGEGAYHGSSDAFYWGLSAAFSF